MNKNETGLAKFEGEKLRFYNIVLCQLQGGFGGAQATHGMSELAVKYCFPRLTLKSEFLIDYMENHKTSVLLSGGIYANMLEMREFLDNESNPFPWSEFHESQEFLGGLMTNLAIILPESVFNFVQNERKHENKPCYPYSKGAISGGHEPYSTVSGLTDYEIELARRISAMPLMK